MTIAQIVSKYQVAESLVHRWKKHLLEQGTEIFDKGRSSRDDPHYTYDIDVNRHGKIINYLNQIGINKK